MTEHSDGSKEVASDRKPTSAILSPTAIGIGGGVAAGIASSFIPMDAIEGFVSAYGIAELLPAAAPPLGNTARLALSTGIGTLTAGALLALLPRGETNDMGFETTVRKDTGSDHTGTNNANTPANTGEPVAGAATAGFGASKLGGWLRTLRFGKTAAAPGEIADFADLTRSRVRIKDQHPDAPVRAPILASSDLGAPLDSPAGSTMESAATPFAVSPLPEPLPEAETEADDALFTLDENHAVAADEGHEHPHSPSLRFALRAEQDIAADDDALASPGARPFNLRAPAIDADVMPVVQAQPAMDAAPDIQIMEQRDVAQAALQDDLDTLSIAALLERLERGLQRRTTQLSAVAAPDAKPAAEGRLFRLAQVDPAATAAPFQAPVNAAEMANEDAAPPFRFRLDRADEAHDEGESRLGTLTSRDTWNGEVEYQAPAIGSAFDDADITVPISPLDEAGELADDGAGDAGPAQPADDDMDAALRDALATLRQLSDRQRNA